MNTRIIQKAGLLAFNILLTFLFLFPLYLILINSFKTKVEVVRGPLAFPTSFSLDNYIDAFQAMGFSSALFNSLLITTLSLIVIIIFSSSFAFFLVRWKWKLNSLIFVLLISSMIIPFQALMTPFVAFYGSLDLLNSKWSLIFFYLGFGLSMSTFMYHGFINNVPKEMDEAALIDGASKLKMFASIIFPILKPITTTIAIINVLWIWNDYLLPSLVLISPTDRTIPLSTFSFFGKYTSDYGVAMAALVFSLIPIILFYLLMQKQIIRGVVEGAVK